MKITASKVATDFTVNADHVIGLYHSNFPEKCLNGYLSYLHLPFYMKTAFIINATI